MSDLAVIFDLDGVLIDSSEFHWESWQVMGREDGFTMTAELFRRTFGMPNRAILPELYGRAMADAEITELSERKEAHFRTLAQGRLQALPGGVELAHALAAAGIPIAIGSSTPLSNIRVALESIGVERCFQQIVCADDVTKGKPDPEVFLKAAGELGAAPGVCVVIEDAVVGVAAAKAAGMRCLAVTTTHPAPALAAADRVVASLAGITPADLAALLPDVPA